MDAPASVKVVGPIRTHADQIVHEVEHDMSASQVVNLSRWGMPVRSASVGVRLFWKGVRDIEGR
jgi:hypothetical protein